MEESIRVPSETMLLCFDSYEGKIAKGRLQTIHYREPFPFESMDHLMLLMDAALDAVKFPSQSQEVRHLEKKAKYEFQKTGELDRDLNQNGSVREHPFHGQMRVTVNRRQHNSMQGMIRINGEKIYFRSVLELMYMLHEYLESHF